MTQDPADIAAQALTELGETPGDNPIAQLAAYAETTSAKLQDMRERMYLTHQPPADTDEYSRTADNTMDARIALVRVHAAREAAELEAIFNLPDAGTTGDEERGHDSGQ